MLGLAGPVLLPPAAAVAAAAVMTGVQTPVYSYLQGQVKFMTFIWRHRVHGQQASYWFDTNDMHALLVQQQDKYHSCLHLVPAHPPALSGELTRIYALF